jgi:hypothetical protein
LSSLSSCYLFLLFSFLSVLLPSPYFVVLFSSSSFFSTSLVVLVKSVSVSLSVKRIFSFVLISSDIIPTRQCSLVWGELDLFLFVLCVCLSLCLPASVSVSLCFCLCVCLCVCLSGRIAQSKRTCIRAHDFKPHSLSEDAEFQAGFVYLQVWIHQCINN